ncbi:MAG: hypothetical protein WD771_11440 [Gemmatimonadaceae bacterium]
MSEPPPFDRIARDLRKEGIDHRRRQDARPRDDGADCRHEFLERGVLHDEAGDTGIHELDDVLVGREEVHHDHLRVRELVARPGRDPQAVPAAQPDVEQDHVGIQPRASLGVVGRLAVDHAEPRLLIDQHRQAVAHEPIILDQRDRDRAGEVRGVFGRGHRIETI